MRRAVFDEPVESWLGPLGYAEPQVNWYLRSTRAFAVEDRRQVNSWYEEVADPTGRLRGRLRSSRDDTHQQSLDELLTNHMLRPPVRRSRFRGHRSALHLRPPV